MHLCQKTTEFYGCYADQTSPTFSLAEHMETSKQLGVEKYRRNLHIRLDVSDISELFSWKRKFAVL